MRLPALVSILVAGALVGCGGGEDQGLFSETPTSPDASLPDSGTVQPDGAAGADGTAPGEDAALPDGATGPDGTAGPDSDTADVSNPPEAGCDPGQMKAQPCGLNGRGTQTDVCENGAWVTGMCADPDDCVDADARQIPCGPGGAGSLQQICAYGQWTNSGDCKMPTPKSGRWNCESGVCKPVFGDPGCGDGTCSPGDGESPKSCKADCGALTAQNGQGKPCDDNLDCAFYAWQIAEPGYWQCKWVSGQDYCQAVQTSSYCGTNGYDYCYYGSTGIETPATCAGDCGNKVLNDDGGGCSSDSDCIFLDWPM